MDFVPEKPALEVDEIRESGRAAKVRAERVPSKMQTVKFRFLSRRVKRRNQPSCTP
jgi:hypothetical protein